MDTITLTDINRMMLSIEHESNSRSKEIKLEAVQEYNFLKSKNLEEGKSLLILKHKKRMEELKGLNIKHENNLRKEYKLKYQILKTEIISNIFNELQNRLANYPLHESLLEQVLKRFNISINNMRIYCSKKDISIVENYLRKRMISEFEICVFPENQRGVLVCSKNGKMFFDNSYESRLRQIKSKHLNLLVKSIFN